MYYMHDDFHVQGTFLNNFILFTLKHEEHFFRILSLFLIFIAPFPFLRFLRSHCVVVNPTLPLVSFEFHSRPALST